MVDLRSDTLTKPTPAMRKMMYEAEVGDDVFQEDPTVNKLEKRIASMFSKEASLFLPTGTMSNLVAAMAWCGQRGAEAILGDCSHMYLYEQGNLAHIAGVSPRALPNRADGTVSLEGIEAAIRASNIHFPQTSLISLENTHNYCGGRVLPDGYIDTVSTLAGKRGIPLHLDGARIWNAATATASTVAELTASVDSVTACLSKGLGAPSGSMLVGPRDFIDRARRHRKALGGGMRQVGVLAAAGLQALDDFEAGVLGTDHRRARHIAEGLSGIPGVEVDPAVVDSNIVLVHLKQEVEGPAVFAAALREEHEVLVMPFGPRTLRLVTHRDLVEEDVTTVVWAFKDVAARMTSTPHAALVLPLSAGKACQHS
jgi:threonine aldolase